MRTLRIVRPVIILLAVLGIFVSGSAVASGRPAGTAVAPHAATSQVSKQQADATMARLTAKIDLAQRSGTSVDLQVRNCNDTVVFQVETYTPTSTNQYLAWMSRAMWSGQKFKKDYMTSYQFVGVVSMFGGKFALSSRFLKLKSPSCGRPIRTLWTTYGPTNPSAPLNAVKVTYCNGSTAVAEESTNIAKYERQWFVSVGLQYSGISTYLYVDGWIWDGYEWVRVSHSVAGSTC